MSRVRMVHPTLPGQEIEIPEAAALGHRASGWITTEEAEAAAKNTAADTATPRAETASESDKPAASPARRTTVKE